MAEETYRVNFTFGIGTGILVTGDALGETVSVVLGGLPVAVRIPRAESAPNVDAPAFAVQKGPNGEITGAQVKSVIVEVDIATEASIEDQSVVERIFADAFAVATGALIGLLERLRVDCGQYFSGPSHVLPQLIGHATMVNLAAGDPVPGRWPSDRFKMVLQDEPAVDLAAFVDAAARVAADEAPHIADVLLADSKEEIHRVRVFAEGRDVSFDAMRAVLLAAIAAEAKVKSTMLDRCPPDRRALVELVVQRGNVGAMTDKPMKAAVGRSLREDEEQLYHAVADRGLFWLRNQIAHGVRRPTEAEARTAVATAVELFKWLELL